MLIAYANVWNSESDNVDQVSDHYEVVCFYILAFRPDFEIIFQSLPLYLEFVLEGWKEKKDKDFKVYLLTYLDTPMSANSSFLFVSFNQARHAGSERRAAGGKKQTNGTAGLWGMLVEKNTEADVPKIMTLVLIVEKCLSHTGWSG